jgi:transposase
MARNLYWLDDREWARIEPHLPKGRRGAHRVDDRRVISGIIHMLKTGARWRDCPADYGPYTTITTASIAGRSKGSGRMSSTS